MCGAPAHLLLCFLSVQASYRPLSSNMRVRDLLPRRMNSLKKDAVSSKNKKKPLKMHEEVEGRTCDIDEGL